MDREVSVDSRCFTAKDRDDGLWDKIESGAWEPNTGQILAELEPGDLFIDIGAWIGWTTLIGASHGATVLAFEPDPVSRNELEENIAANPGIAVTVVPAALSNRSGERQLTAPYTLGDSMGSIVRRSRAKPGHRATVVRVDDVRGWLPEFDGARLVKIDTEGAEYQIVPAMREWLTLNGPDLMLSLHTYHLDGMIRRLPVSVRGIALRLATVVLRRRLLWLARLYPSKFVALDGVWKPLTRRELWATLARPGDIEVLLRGR